MNFDTVLGMIAILVALLGLGTALYSTVAAVLLRWRRAAEGIRISERSQQADKRLEEALAEPNRRAGVENEHPDESLVLARLWASVNGRLDRYHSAAQDQGDRSFSAAMSATWVGFALVVAGGIAATTVQNTTGAIVAGVLGAVSAAAAGYIAKTFLRTYEGTSNHLRSYFLHPVEISRYLSAERLIAQSGLSVDAQAELMRVLVHSMVTGALAETPDPSAKRTEGSSEQG